MGRTIGDVLRCSSSAVTPVLPNAQSDRGGIAHRLRPLGQGREVPMGCRPAEDVVNVLDQPASCGDFLAGQAFTADDVYVGSHLRFDLSNR
jgi:hypothetical protein